ncbi:MAG: OmpA family protein [Actinomycetales bacterium]|nr:OmpA family protein [Actinomycetales bacterium]
MPAGTAGAVDVVVTNPDTQSATGTGAFTYYAVGNAVVMNDAGGVTSSDGLRIKIGPGWRSIVRNNLPQTYNSSTYRWGNIAPSAWNATALDDPFNGVLLVIGSTVACYLQASQASNGCRLTSLGSTSLTSAAWDSAVTTLTSSSSPYQAMSVLQKTLGGVQYRLTMTTDYTSPNNYADVTYTLDIASGTNTANVRLYDGIDMYLDGEDYGPVKSFSDAGKLTVVQYNDTGVGGFRQFSSSSADAFGSYTAPRYLCLFGGTGASDTCPDGGSVSPFGNYGPYDGTDYPNLLATDPEVDAGVGVAWDLGVVTTPTTKKSTLYFAALASCIPCNPPAPPSPSGGGGSTAAPEPEPVAESIPEPVASVKPVVLPNLDPIPNQVNANVPAGGVPAGGSVFLVNGQPTPVTVAPNAPRAATGLDVSGPDFTMRLSGRGDDADPLGLGDRSQLVLQAPAAPRQRSGSVAPRSAALAKCVVTVPLAVSSGTGFQAGSPVKLYLLPSTYIGSLTADGSGAYSGSLPVPAGVTPGAQTLQVNGFSKSGAVRSLSLGITVIPARTVATKTSRKRVFFDPLSPTLSAQGRKQLNALARKAKRHGVRAVAVGFVQQTSSRSNDESLSTRRARNVARFLRSRGVTGAYVIRGDGVAGSGDAARRVNVTVTYQTGC